MITSASREVMITISREDIVAKRALPIGAVALLSTSRFLGLYKDELMLAIVFVFRGLVLVRRNFFRGRDDKGIDGDVLERALGNIQVEIKRGGASFVQEPTSERKSIIQRRGKIYKPGGLRDGLGVDDLTVYGERDNSGRGGTGDEANAKR